MRFKTRRSLGGVLRPLVNLFAMCKYNFRMERMHA